MEITIKSKPEIILKGSPTDIAALWRRMPERDNQKEVLNSLKETAWKLGVQVEPDDLQKSENEKGDTHDRRNY